MDGSKQLTVPVLQRGDGRHGLQHEEENDLGHWSSRETCGAQVLAERHLHYDQRPNAEAATAGSCGLVWSSKTLQAFSKN